MEEDFEAGSTAKTYLPLAVGIAGVIFGIAALAFAINSASRASALEKSLKGKAVKPFLYEGLDSVSDYLKNNRINKVGVDFGTTTLKENAEYKKAGIKTFDCGDEIARIRAVKSAEEIENIKKACSITEKAFYKAVKSLRLGITEKEFCEILENEYYKLGADGLAFPSIVAFGKNSSVPHHVTGDTKLKINDVVLVDTGCTYKGYSSDFTRTLFFGSPDEEFIKAYNAVLETNVLAESKATAGVTGKELDAIARENLDKFGLAEYFTHSLGHGLGLEIHERPYLSRKGEGTLSEGMAFTIEPGVYFKGKFGIRIEDTLIIENEKAKRLFGDEKDLIIKKIN